MRRLSHKLWLPVALVLLVLAVVVTRVAVASHGAFAEGVALEERGEEALAALAYRQAVAWYLPGNPWVTRAIERMWALADAAEARGDLVGARIIVSDLRGALYGIRHVVQPHETELRLCDERLAQLLAHTDERVLGGQLSPETVLPEYSAAVKRDHAPSVGWSLALGLGFLGWILATFTGLWRLSRPSAPDEGLAWRAAAPWLLFSLLCLATWLAGAAFA